MYCKRCQQFQDHIGALIHRKQSAQVNTQSIVEIEEDADADPDADPDAGNEEASGSVTPKSPASTTHWPSYEAVLFKSLEELRAVYNSTCPLCRRVFRCIDKHDWSILNGFRSVVTVLDFGSNKNKPTLSARLDTDPTLQSVKHTDRNPFRSTRNLKYLSEYIEEIEDGDPLLETLRDCVRTENKSTGSEGSLAMARFWIEECLHAHPDCKRASSGWLPTRVIDVSEYNNGEMICRLVETSSLPLHESELPDFVALSHCWGTKQIITTTVDTYEDRQRGIGFQQLSKTFQDAVLTTRNLGLRYLWIDSLCIIQDSVQDWKTESVQMCTIYERALFTIMAAHASGGDEGCFVKRDGLAQLPFTLRFNFPDNSHSQIACFQSPDHGQGLRPQFSPVLFSRAWVLQEQFNSQARLIFFGEQIHWECKTIFGSEQRPLDGKKIWDLVSGPGTLAVETIDDTDTLEEMHIKWYELIRNYTRRGITKSLDRLVAIDGVAQSLQKRTPDKYLAGLWLAGLPNGLLWYIPWRLTKAKFWKVREEEAECFMSSRHGQQLAPTWSWASVTYPIDWLPLYNKGITACDVVQAGAYGSVFGMSGTVVLRGMTRSLFVKPYYQKLHFTGLRERNPMIKEFSLSGMKDDEKWSTYICYASTRKPSWLNWLAPYPMEFFPDEIFDHTKPVTFITLGYIKGTDMYKGNVRHYRAFAMTVSQRSIHTLALQATSEDPNTFRRVGFASWNNCSWFGYFCVGEKFQLEILLRLSKIQEELGLAAMVRAIPVLLFAWFWSELLGQSILHVHNQGLIWFRSLIHGNGNKHDHDGDIRSRDTYRTGYEAEERTIKIV